MKYFIQTFFIMLFIIFCLFYFFYLSRKIDIKPNSDYFKPAGINYIEKRNLEACQVPTLNSDKCFFTQYQECPRYNGSYSQCTNNYIPKPDQNNCDCQNRTFEMCPSPYKISEKCYYDKLKID